MLECMSMWNTEDTMRSVCVRGESMQAMARNDSDLSGTHRIQTCADAKLTASA